MSKVNHPSHYGGADNIYEAIKIIEAHNLNFNLGNAIKYILRAGIKDPNRRAEDLQKAEWYLKREIATQKAADIAKRTAETGCCGRCDGVYDVCVVDEKENQRIETLL